MIDHKSVNLTDRSFFHFWIEIAEVMGKNVAFTTTLVSLIIVQQILLIFWKIPSCTALFHPARLLILGNFKPKPLFLLIKNEKFQPARPYSILHVY